MKLGHLINIWGSVLVIVATHWWARECWGSSWIVVSQPGMAARAAPSLPSCPSYCLQGYPSAKLNLMAGLWWCSGLGALHANEKWNVSTSSSGSAFFVVDAEGKHICLDVGNASTILAGTSQLPAASARSVVLAYCDSSSPTQQWILDDDGYLKSVAGSSYVYPYQTPHHNDVYFLYLIEDKVSALSGFVMVDTSLMDSYYKPPLPPNNQSNLILNGNLKLLTSFAPLTAQPPLESIVTDWTATGVWDGFYFVVCHWEVHGPALALGGCNSSSCQLPQEWCSGSNADEMLLSLNSIDGTPGWIMQTVPTYPGSNYLLFFEMRNPRSQTQKLQLSVSQVVTSSAIGNASEEFEILPYQNDSQTHQYQFIASGNFVNVTFSSQNTTECGPLINNIQLYLMWPLAAEQNVVLPNHARGASRLKLAVTIAGWALAVTLCSGVALYIARNLWRRKHSMLTGSSASIPDTLKVPITIFSFEQLKTYTENFSTLIGEGGYGKVYFGRLPQSNQPIAVKRQNDADNASFFQAEVALLSRVHHRYIVKFLGYCEDKGERMLVFEYMPNKSLHSRLHGPESMPILRWEERVQIAYQVAYALEYLHNGANPAVLHRDVKSANVLLSSNMVAKLADMGISKVRRPNEVGTSSTMTEVKGSRGYMDPYYLQTSMISHKSDVYSFGVLLLEMVTGQKVITSAPSELLTVWAKRVYWDAITISDGGSGNVINYILDSRLRGMSVPDATVKAVMEIARSCLHEEPRHRPSMAELARRLREQLPSSAHVHMDHEFSADDYAASTSDYAASTSDYVASTSNDTFSGR